jgi:anti-sigma regulatory factor (Ser/Thr protein kinase)
LPWLVEVRTCVQHEASSHAVSDLRLPAKPSELSAARRYAEEAATAFGLDADGCYEFVFAVNEAVTNAIRHGTPDEQGQIHLGITTSPDRLTFIVRDCGTFVPFVRMSNSKSEHGRGLALMAKLVDEVQLCSEPGSTTVRLSKARAGYASPAKHDS